MNQPSSSALKYLTFTQKFSNNPIKERLFIEHPKRRLEFPRDSQNPKTVNTSVQDDIAILKIFVLIAKLLLQGSKKLQHEQRECQCS